MKFRSFVFVFPALLAFNAGCSSATTAPATDDASVDEDTFVPEETGDEDTGTEEDTAKVDSAKADTATADTRPAVDSVVTDVAADMATECVTGSTGSEGCGKCGTRSRACIAGAWSAWGDCKGEADCSPGSVETGTGACTGRDVSTRTCSSTCAWSSWTCVPPKGWVDIATSPLTARYGHSAVWTGSEMLVWGGNPSLADGAAYSVTTDTWRALPASTIVGRENHSTVWTGSKMIVWGGAGSGYRNDGASYDVATATWTTLPATTLIARHEHTAVWTGSEMIVWGGSAGSFPLKDGAAYSPSTGWRTIAAAPASFGARSGHRAVWAGGKMVIFGGYEYFSGYSSPAPGSCAAKTSTSYCSDAAAYDPATNTWELLTPPTPALDPRYRTAGVVAGATNALALFWGGTGNTVSGSLNRNTGAFYNTASSMWTAMTTPTETVLPGSKRVAMVAWSSGDTFFVWGGLTGTSTRTDTGASYDIPTATWKALPTVNAPAARSFATVVWTGSEAVVWGGQGSAGVLNNGKLYRP